MQTFWGDLSIDFPNESRKKVGQKLVTRQKENPGAFEK